MTLMGAGGQSREVAAGDLFEDYLTTAVGPDEILTEIRLPSMDGWGHGYEKFNRRAEDWAMVGVVALVKKAADGSCEDVRIGLTHMGSTPLRASATEDALRGGGARRAEHRQRGRARRRRARIRRATSTRRRTTSATSRGCSRGGR